MEQPQAWLDKLGSNHPISVRLPPNKDPTLPPYPLSPSPPASPQVFQSPLPLAIVQVQDSRNPYTISPSVLLLPVLAEAELGEDDVG